MQLPKLSLILIFMPLLTADWAWADACGFPGPDQVVIYQHKNRGGPCRLLEMGLYPTASSFGLPEDSILAIDVGSNVRAVLYQNERFDGKQAHFEGGFNYGSIEAFGFIQVGFNRKEDRTSSIEIFRMQGGPAATHFLGDYPKNRENFWSQDAQGLANDGANWYVVNTPTDVFGRAQGALARIHQVPLSYDLSTKHSDGLRFAQIPRELLRLGYDHLGDPDQRSGFLFVPIEGEGNSRIGVWWAQDLRFLSSFEISENRDTKHGTINQSTPWVAIHPGRETLWTSHSNDVDHVREYDIDWEQLTGTYPSKLILSNPRDIMLQDRDGKTITLNSMQGGVFNPSGTLLYTSDGRPGSGHVHVFNINNETNTATLQAKSGNGYGPFNFANRSGFLGDEAEGLDWLDVRGLHVPHIPEGQLHLVMVDNDTNPDDVYLKHYSGRTDQGVSESTDQGATPELSIPTEVPSQWPEWSEPQQGKPPQ